MKQLLLIRHATAEDCPDSVAIELRDSARGLTPSGRHEMLRAARGLRVHIPVFDSLFVSPLRRARQTSAMLSWVYRHNPPATQCSALTPESELPSMLSLLATQKHVSTLVCVGHLPTLIYLANVLLKDKSQALHSFGKGGACLLTCRREFTPNSAQLVWQKTAQQLARAGYTNR